MFDASKLFSESPLDKRPIIGAVKVNKPFVYHDASYECAAWWEDREAELGVYPVYLGRGHHHPKHLNITAHIKAKVKDDYFAGLWGGVPISREPYKPKHIGEERIIYQGIEVVDAIQRTGNSPGNDLDWFIHPSWWKVFTDEAVAELYEAHQRFPEFWERFASLNRETWKPHGRSQQELRWSFDDEYRSKIGMVAYFGGLFEKWSRRIEKINWHSQYHDGASYDTLYHRDNFSKNTEWIKAVPIQVNES